MESVEVLDEPANVPDDLIEPDRSEGVYAPAPEHLHVELQLGPGYEWVSEYYRCESVVGTPEGRVAGLRVSDPAWVRRLVLGSNGRVAVLDPQWLADEIKVTAKAALEAYPAGSQ
jgi:proteasome accessory factor C